MQAITEKQILEWKEELDKQTTNKIPNLFIHSTPCYYIAILEA